MNYRRFVYKYGYYLAKAYWYLVSPHIVAVACVVTRGDTVLLVRHTYGNTEQWRVPSGILKHGEAPVVAAEREIWEETGLKISDLRTWDPITLNDDFKTVELYPFAANSATGELKRDENEIADIGWFPVANLPKPMNETSTRLIKLAT